MNEDLSQFFDEAGRNWASIVSRQGVKVEVPEWGNKDGPATFYVKPVSARRMSFYNQFNHQTQGHEWASAFVVAVSHNMMGEPFFYQEKLANGDPLDEELIRQSMNAAFNKFMDDINPRETALVANRFVKALADESFTPSHVGNSSPQTEQGS